MKKKYLVRGGADPLVSYKPRDLLKTNYIGGNSGNMMFLYGVINVLTTESASCVVTNRKSNWSDEEIRKINEEYDAVIFPMADAFRPDYVSDLRKYTSFINKLRIPCVVIGVGLRAKYEPNLEEKRSFDDDVKAFVKAVLDHSSQIGLRGEVTGKYLEKIGFTEGTDFKVIGCPSLYMHGTSIDKREPAFEKIGINLNAIASQEINDFYIRSINSHDNIHIVQQRGIEFLDWYYGRKVDLSTFVPEYPPYNIFDKIEFDLMKKEGKVHFYLDVPSWLESVRSFGVFAGCRFHGVVAAILAGVPSAITPIDSRTREFSLFHHIPQIPKEDMMSGKSFEDCLQSLDYSEFHKYHMYNLENYISFLAHNGLESIFDPRLDMEYGSSPLERNIIKSDHNVYQSFDTISAIEKAQRTFEYWSVKSIKSAKKAIRKSIVYAKKE